MSGVKIGPTGTVPQVPVARPEATGQRGAARPESAGEAGAAGVAAQLVERMRQGQITVEQAVDILVEHALEAVPADAVTDVQRAEMRRVLAELVHDDPALSGLVRSMSR